MRLRRPPGPLIGAAFLAGAVAVGAASSCSTLETGAVPECRDDADCDDRSVCSLDSNTCVPEALPPRPVLGFDVVEAGDVRIELRGCDPEVSRQLGSSELRVAKHSSLFQDFSIQANAVESIINNCGGNTCEGGVCDEQALTCTTPLDAAVNLRMRSRLGLDVVVSTTKELMVVTDPPLMEGQLPPPVTLSWPDYATTPAPDPADPATADSEAFPATQLSINPAAESSASSPYRFVLAPDAGEEVVATGLARCMRGIIGGEASVRTVGGAAVADAAVQFFYDEPIATPSTVLGTGASCTSDDGCNVGWACDLDHQRCGLDLTDVLAGSSLSRADPAGSFATAHIYTYCEEFVSDIDPLERRFLVRVKPSEDSGQPTMEYELNQAFPAKQPNTLGEVNLQGGLCLPDWGPPQPVSFSLTGAPVKLLESELGDYTCCSTSCLPSPDAEQPTPPPSVDSCTNFDTADFESLWFNDDPVAWAFAGCIATSSSGRYFRSVASADEACTPEGCAVALTAGDLEAEDSRLYTVSIEQPPESVFRSQRFAVPVTEQTESLPAFELRPRVLVRGQVSCSAEDCSFVNAIVAAEQLRTDGSDSDIPGPFFFQARVDAGGNFVLPVDPGIYVMTAYPAISAPGAPAPYRVIDLREDSSEISEVDGVPSATLDPFELEDGVLVRVQLRGFDVSTKVTPIDTGSWTYQDDFLAEVDLNDPQTCLTSGTRGCTIRRVRPTDTPLPLLLAGQFQFTTRDRGPDACPE